MQEQQMSNEINRNSMNIIRIDERLINISNDINQIDEIIDDHESRIRQLEASVHKNSFVTSGLLKFVGWFIVAGLSVVAYLLRS